MRELATAHILIEIICIQIHLLSKGHRLGINNNFFPLEFRTYGKPVPIICHVENQIKESRMDRNSWKMVAMDFDHQSPLSIGLIHRLNEFFGTI